MNTELGILICQPCQRGINSSAEGVLKHLEKYHCQRGKTIQKACPTLKSSFEEVLECYEFSDPSAIKEQLPDRPAIPGIQVFQGYFCPVEMDKGVQCLRAFRVVGSLYEHVKKHHSSLVQRPKQSELGHYTCECQTIYSNPVKYFRVRAGSLLGSKSRVESSVNPYSVFLQCGNTKPSFPHTPEAITLEELPSLLRATRWDIFIGDHRENPKDVVDLICYPKADKNNSELEAVLCKLPHISECWVDVVEDYFFRNGTEWQERILAGYPM